MHATKMKDAKISVKITCSIPIVELSIAFFMNLANRTKTAWRAIVDRISSGFSTCAL